MNVGLNNATGEWLWFLNAGDECMKNISIELLCTIDSCKASVIKSGVQAIKQNTKIMFGRVVSPHQGTFYRRNVLTSIGGYREDYKIISDWIAFNVLLSKNTKMHQSELIVAKFYENGVSSTQQGKRLISKEALKYAIECPTDLFRWYRFFKSIYKLCRKILQ
jgi:hypothetical protein